MSVHTVLLTNIVVIVRVVLKRVSVTLIDGSFFSMDSPSSECHRPICKESTHTYTHKLIQTDQSLSPSAEKGQQKQFVLDCLPLLLKRISMTFTKDCIGQKQSSGQMTTVLRYGYKKKVSETAGGNKDNMCGSLRSERRACVQSEETECIH